MNWEYDYWNRIKKITYPDGEKVDYSYNRGGLLRSMRGEKGGEEFAYINDGQYFEWDRTGNMKLRGKSADFDMRRLCWDEENRLSGVADDTYSSFYYYDAGGERTVKLSGYNKWVDVNGVQQGFAELHTPTLYTSPYLVASQKGYTKHYYIENQRIVSKLGGGDLRESGEPVVSPEEVQVKQERLAQLLHATTGCLQISDLNALGLSDKYCGHKSWLPVMCRYEELISNEKDIYFYHPDHLGSSSWITDFDGLPVQHLSYLPFGEEFVDQRTSDWSAAFKFTGKEKDEETGYNYFGARYYMSDLGIWASVDPLSDMYPSWSAYNYCLGNPIKLIDPDGTKVVIPDEEDQKFIDNLIDVNSKDYSKDFHDIYKELDAKDHIYSFESWAYGSDKDDGKFKTITNSNKSIINFTKDDNPQITEQNIGASRYRVLFEEIYHAKQHANGSRDNSCIREAEAWKFSSFAPGTKTKYDNNGYERTTVMGRLQNSSISSIAWGFKMGMPLTTSSAGISGSGLYKQLPLGNKNEMQLYFPILRGIVK